MKNDGSTIYMRFNYGKYWDYNGSMGAFVGRFWRVYHELLYKLLVIESMGDTWDLRVILYGDIYIYVCDGI